MPASPRVLIADDEPALAENLVAELTALWPDATLLPAVHDGQSVLDVIDDAADGQGPDVVFLDIRMPGLSGIDVARELSQREMRPLVAFVTWGIRRLVGEGSEIFVSMIEPEEVVTQATVQLIENGYPDITLVTPAGHDRPGTPVPGRSAA